MHLKTYNEYRTILLVPMNIPLYLYTFDDCYRKGLATSV